MKKRLLTLVLATALSVITLAGCGGSSTASTTAAPATEAATTAAAETEAPQSEEPVVVTLGVTGGDKDMWAGAQRLLAEEGIDLQFVEFSDYVTPNNALDNGDTDLNSFQHEVYLDGEVEAHGYKIEKIAYTIISPLNVFSSKISSIDELKDGDVVALPNDLTNEGRALKVLANAGILTLTSDELESPTPEDIESYNVAIELKELEANTIPSVLPDVTAAVINANYSRDFGLTNDDVIFFDEGSGSERYWNLIAARSADLEDPDRVALFRRVVNAYHSDATKEVLENDLGGVDIPVGWDIDLLAGK